MGHGFRFLLPPFLYYPPPPFSKLSYKSFPPFSKLYDNFEKGGGGSREKGEGGNELHAPCACVKDLHLHY